MRLPWVTLQSHSKLHVTVVKILGHEIAVCLPLLIAGTFKIKTLFWLHFWAAALPLTDLVQFSGHGIPVHMSDADAQFETIVPKICLSYGCFKLIILQNPWP